MASNRPKMILDEQSFEDMLAAAYTIQQHNAQRKMNLAPPPQLCRECGIAIASDQSLCVRCEGVQDLDLTRGEPEPAREPRGDEPRPGETLQRKWASLWMMSQEQGFGLDDFSTNQQDPSQESAKSTLAALDLQPQHVPSEGRQIEDHQTEHFQRDQVQPERYLSELRAGPVRRVDAVEIPLAPEHPADFDPWPNNSAWPVASSLSNLATTPGLLPEAEIDDLEALNDTARRGSLRDLRLKLRVHRADFYLVVAIAVSTIAMLWVLVATPLPGTQQKPRLRPWERALVSFGLAEAPQPPARRGNPNISVWVDPKTALYYCAGEDLYAKAPGGHFATQREAQLDQFEPASRVPCE
jgi:hypothetical protein